MSVTLIRPYGGYASGTVVTLPDDTEAALVAQGYASYASGQPAQTFSAKNGALHRPTVGGNDAFAYPGRGFSAPATPQGPRVLPNFDTTAFASSGSSSVHVAGTIYLAEIYVPHLAAWTGISILNGATVGTDNILGVLYDSAGNLITTSALAGALSAGANTFQLLPFLTQPLLVPGRYFGGVQCNGTTATTRKLAAADGARWMTTAVAGTFGTVPSTVTVPTTFTTGQGPQFMLYQ